MLGIMLLGFVVYVGVMAAFTGMVQGSLLDAITEVPTIHAYDKQTGKRITVISEDVRQRAALLLEEQKRLNDEMFRLASMPVSGNLGFAGAAANDTTARPAANLAQLDGSNSTIEAIKLRQNEINRELQDIGWHDQKSSKYAMYLYFAIPVTGILVVIIVFTAAVHFWEKGLQLVNPGTALRMLKRSTYCIAIIWILPEVWDIFAILVTDFAILMLDPINQQPQSVIDGLWCKMGAASGCIFDFAGLLNPISWSTALANPADFGQSLLGEVLMPFFMLTPALMTSLGIFIISHIRILFLNFMLISLPVWLLLMHVKYISNEAERFVHGMFGAALAPFMTTLTLFIGWMYVSTTPIPSIEEWITVLGIITLAGSWPLTLAPVIGSASNTVQGTLSTAITSTSMMAMQMGMGTAAGAIAGAAGGGGAKGLLSGMITGGARSTLGAMPNAAGGASEFQSVAQSGLIKWPKAKNGDTKADDSASYNPRPGDPQLPYQ